MATTASATGIDLRGARVLLVAPHPDDESLALGGLIQQAVRQRAHVTLLQVTDGDNNPWPQRWLERRWRIGLQERERWGRRRVAEVHDALQLLCLPRAALLRLGWPDLGVADRLRDDGVRGIDAFAAVVRAAAPDIAVLPALGDRHPDHGASHVLMRLALARQALRPVCLTYLVHGNVDDAGQPCAVALDSDAQAAKRRAVTVHRTQMALSRRRLLAMVEPTEHLRRLAPREYDLRDLSATTIALPWHPPVWLQPWLVLTLAHPDGCHTWPWRQAPVVRSGGNWLLKLPANTRRWPVFAHLASRLTSPWIFDHWGWRDLTAMPLAGQAHD